MTRVAFPLKLCYAMSINKSQGQSFEQVIVDTTHDAFSHGHTYVSLSRTRSYKSICLIVTPENIIEHPYFDDDGELQFKTCPLIVNTVFPSVIQKLP